MSEPTHPLDPWEQDWANHYFRFLRGGQVAVHTSPDAPWSRDAPLRVLEFAPEPAEPADDPGDWRYFTIGASRRPMPYPADWTGARPERHFELLLFARESHEELFRSLAALAAYPFALGTYLDVGHTIAGNGTGIVEGSPLTEILLLHPHFMPQDFYLRTQAESAVTHILWVVPVYPAERAFARNQGDRALEARFAAAGTDAADLWRAPVV